jgi:hypothetical protein
VGLVASAGEDYHSDIEQAVIFRAEGDGRYTRVWQGEGNHDERAMDACFTVVNRDFTFVDARTLTIASSGTARFQNQGARSSGCVGSAARPPAAASA